MYYYKVNSTAPFSGTDTEIFFKSETKLDTEEIALLSEEEKEDLFESYGYLINGWDGRDPTEEEYEDFIAECYVEVKELTKEEFAEEN